MPLYDLPKEQLLTYAPVLARPDDLEDFWSSTLADSRALAQVPVFSRMECGLALVDTFDVTFSGYGGHPIKAWLHLPAGTREPLPTVVTYIGYGGGRGLAHEVSVFALAGYGSFVVDTRGQGSGWGTGDTPDPAGAGPAHPGFMTRGILHRDDYYYRRVYTDAVLALDAARAHPLVRNDNVAVAGTSQGGGLALVTAALGDNVWAVMADVPFLCDFPRATEIASRGPFTEIVAYLKVHRNHVSEVFSTLAYFDAATLVRDARAPALFSVAMMDQICPPSTVYAAHNLYGGSKEIIEYRFNDHEGGQVFQQVEQLRWLAAQTR